MKLKPTHRMQFRRRREVRTDYQRRLKLLKSRKPRLVVRRSLKYIRVQVVNFDKAGDKTAVAASSEELKKLGWDFACDNVPAAYLVGLMIGKRAVKKGIKEVVLDTGLHISSTGSRLYGVAKGAIDSGLEVAVGEEVFPKEERIKGLHIANYMEKFKAMPDEFEKIKQKVLGE